MNDVSVKEETMNCRTESTNTKTCNYCIVSQFHIGELVLIQRDQDSHEFETGEIVSSLGTKQWDIVHLVRFSSGERRMYEEHELRGFFARF